MCSSKILCICVSGPSKTLSVGLYSAADRRRSKAKNPRASEEYHDCLIEYLSLICTSDFKLTSGFLVIRSDKDPDLLSSTTLGDFQIVCTLAVGEFGHVDLVGASSHSCSPTVTTDLHVQLPHLDPMFL